MKKVFSAFLILIFSCLVWAESYQIKEVTYNTVGCGAAFFSYTKPYAIEKNIIINKKRIFASEEELTEYLKDFELKLYSLRAFETIDLDYSITKNPDFSEQSQKKDQNEHLEKKSISAQNLVYVTVSTKDSFHLLGVPYPKYDSNTGTVVKLKIKDTNFLGSLNAMSADINFSLIQKSEDETPETKVGLTFAYDHPFKIGIFDFTWVNDYSINYTFGNSIPEWDAKTGLKSEFSSGIATYTLEFYQKASNNFDYISFDDAIYFNENVKFSVPLKLYEFERHGTLTYTPYIDASFNWDYNGINKTNTSLSSPIITLGHSISASRINWSHNLRNGHSTSISNSYSYNFQRNMLYPYLEAEVKLYKAFELFQSEKDIFNRLGITADLFAFVHFVDNENPYFGNDGTKIGGRLRGIRDEQTFSFESTHPDWLACLSSSAFVLNIDFPYHLFSTNFTWKFMKYLNFDLQISPFFDMALGYNKITQKWFHPKDGFYAGGVEFLVYPAKWAGFTVRGSIGFDLGRMFLSDILNTHWRDDPSKFEISFGIGLHY